MSDVNYEAELMNRAQGEQMIQDLGRMSDALESIAGGSQQQISIPRPIASTFVYDGTPKTIQFEDYNPYKSFVVNDTEQEPGTYVAVVYLSNPSSDTWADGTTAPKRYAYTIEYDSGATSFAGATTEKIIELVTAADAGECDLAEDYGWAVGDEREIELGSMAESVVVPDGTTVTVGESHVAQKATLVLMDTDKFDLVEETPGGRTKSQFVVGLKNSLIENGYMGGNHSWLQCPRRKWCNFIFREALPTEWKRLFKKFKVKTAETINGSITINETEDYFALFAEKEIFGEKLYTYEIEANALSQIAYYESPANRIKKNGELDTSSAYSWWERSPHTGYSGSFCVVGADGSALSDYHSGISNLTLGLAPFGCL